MDAGFGSIDRRGVIAAMLATVAAPPLHAAAAPAIDIVARDLIAPEGPRMLASGSLLFCQLGRGEVSRLDPDGITRLVAKCGGSPNGLAIGPDGAAYVCNSGGFDFERVGDTIEPRLPAPGRPANGSLQHVDLHSGAVATLFDTADGHHLAGPNDIVFDTSGGYWFTDSRFPAASPQSETGAVFYVPAGGAPRLAARVGAANGVALSPDARTLYVVRSMKPSGVHAFALRAPGRIIMDATGLPTARVLAGQGRAFDSLSVEAGGNLVLGTLFRGGLTVLSPDGTFIEEVSLPDRFVTNVCFGDADLRTAYATLTTTGRIARVAWPRPGLRPAFA